MEGPSSRAEGGPPWAASPVIRAGYQRPSGCLARHADPACRELRSGSWKGRSSSTETTCPWENLQRGPQGRGLRYNPQEACEPQRTKSNYLGIALKGGRNRETKHTNTCPHIYTYIPFVHIHTHTCTRLCCLTLAFGMDMAPPRMRMLSALWARVIVWLA